MTGNTQGA